MTISTCLARYPLSLCRKEKANITGVIQDHNEIEPFEPKWLPGPETLNLTCCKVPYIIYSLWLSQFVNNGPSWRKVLEKIVIVFICKKNLVNKDRDG